MSFLARLFKVLLPGKPPVSREREDVIFSAPGQPLDSSARNKNPSPHTPAREDASALWNTVDTLSAIQNLDSVLSSHPNAPDAGEISLALGSLFRAKGDIDRAVSLRESILARPGLSAPFRARTLFELGLDYRRAGLLDRAHLSFQEARRHGFSDTLVREELAQIQADSGNFKAASEAFAALGQPRAEAYFLVRQAEETAASGKDKPALALVQKAIEAFPGSPEAWRALASMHLLAGEGSKAAEHLNQGLARADKPGKFILLQGLYDLCEASFPQDLTAANFSRLLTPIVEALRQREPGLIFLYYGGRFLLHAGEWEEAEQWFSKALVLRPDFWATRMALLQLSSRRVQLPPVLSGQIDYFLRVGSRVKRFVCLSCGMRLETIFSRCPRCLAWHSATFRLSLN